MLYLAAIDTTQAPTDGFTFETRLEHFIDELAHINRAHNWDTTRINATGVSEEYDGLDADKPSCYSGVKRRLLQAVLGHPLLKILTKDDIKQELREFVREHFKQVIEAGDGQALHHAWQQLIDSGHVDDCLIALNIPKQKQQDFIRYLSDKYPNQFDDDLGFKAYAEQRLMQTPHAQFFGGETDLTGLLEEHEPYAAPGMN